MAKKAPTDRDRDDAVSRLLSGLIRGEDLFELAAAIEHLHPRHNTCPGEVFVRLCGRALDLAGVGRDRPIACEGLLASYLAEYRFRDGRTARSGSPSWPAPQPAVVSSRICWTRSSSGQTDDFWWYALAQSVPAFTERLAARTATT